MKLEEIETTKPKEEKIFEQIKPEDILTSLKLLNLKLKKIKNQKI